MEDGKYTYSFIDIGDTFSVCFNGLQYHVSQDAALIARAILALADTLEKIGNENE